jgi:hypothetical protein
MIPNRQAMMPTANPIIPEASAHPWQKKTASLRLSEEIVRNAIKYCRGRCVSRGFHHCLFAGQRFT